jgi:hypothetical protein
MADNTQLVNIDKGIKRLVKLIEMSTIVDKASISEQRKQRQWTERARDEQGRFIAKQAEIQEERATQVTKNTELLTSQKSFWSKFFTKSDDALKAAKDQKDKERTDFVKSFKEQWKLIKERSRVIQLAKKFWQSEAGQAIRNIAGRVKGVVDEILGEVGEFFKNLWGTLQDSFQFVKGTVGSVIDGLRGGDRKERREKEQAKDIKKVRQSLTRQERRGLLKRDKKKSGLGIMDILRFLGLGLVAGGGTIGSVLLGLLKAVFLRYFPIAAIGNAIYKGIKEWFETGEFKEGLKAALKGLLQIPKWIVGTILSGIDLFFDTELRPGFEEGWKELENTLDNIIEFLFVNVPRAFKNAWERLKKFDLSGAYEAFAGTLQDSEYAQKTMEEREKEEEEKQKAFMEKWKGDRKFSELDEDPEDIMMRVLEQQKGDNERKLQERERKRREVEKNAQKQREKQTKILEDISKKPVGGGLVVPPGQQGGNMYGPDTDFQRLQVGN